eukprot:952730_1
MTPNYITLTAMSNAYRPTPGNAVSQTMWLDVLFMVLIGLVHAVHVIRFTIFSFDILNAKCVMIHQNESWSASRLYLRAISHNDDMKQYDGCLFSTLWSQTRALNIWLRFATVLALILSLLMWITLLVAVLFECMVQCAADHNHILLTIVPLFCYISFIWLKYMIQSINIARYTAIDQVADDMNAEQILLYNPDIERDISPQMSANTKRKLSSFLAPYFIATHWRLLWHGMAIFATFIEVTLVRKTTLVNTSYILKTMAKFMLIGAFEWNFVYLLATITFSGHCQITKLYRLLSNYKASRAFLDSTSGTDSSSNSASASLSLYLKSNKILTFKILWVSTLFIVALSCVVVGSVIQYTLLRFIGFVVFMYCLVMMYVHCKPSAMYDLWTCNMSYLKKSILKIRLHVSGDENIERSNPSETLLFCEEYNKTVDEQYSQINRMRHLYDVYWAAVQPTTKSEKVTRNLRLKGGCACCVVTFIISLFMTVIWPILMGPLYDTTSLVEHHSVNATCYPVCDMSWHGDLTVVDLVSLTQIVYEIGNEKDIPVQHLISMYFDESILYNNTQPTWEVIHYSTEEPVFLHARNSEMKCDVIAIRGTKSNLDFMEDFSLYFAVGLIQTISTVVPIQSMSPRSFLIRMIYFSSLFEAAVDGGIRSKYDEPIYNYAYNLVSNYADDWNALYFTGHSLGGAVAQFVAAQFHQVNKEIFGKDIDIKSLSLAAPGTIWNSERFGFNIKDLQETAVALIPQYDIVSKVDEHGGMIQHLQCREPQFLSCHFVMVHICELFTNCPKTNTKEHNLLQTICQEEHVAGGAFWDVLSKDESYLEMQQSTEYVSIAS